MNNFIGYVVFEDVGLNCRIYHSFHRTYKQAYRAQRKHRGCASIGFMSKVEYELVVNE